MTHYDCHDSWLDVSVIVEKRAVTPVRQALSGLLSDIVNSAWDPGIGCWYSLAKQIVDNSRSADLETMARGCSMMLYRSEMPLMWWKWAIKTAVLGQRGLFSVYYDMR